MTVERPGPIAAFHTTKRVITHRIRITDPQPDDSLEALVADAYEEVGPGFRGG